MRLLTQQLPLRISVVTIGSHLVHMNLTLQKLGTGGQGMLLHKLDFQVEASICLH